MTPLAQDLFAQARELPTAQREAFLKNAWLIADLLAMRCHRTLRSWRRKW